MAPYECGVLSSENSDRSLRFSWKSVPISRVKSYPDGLRSHLLSYKKKTWWFQLSGSSNFGGSSDLILRIVDISNRQNMSAFKDHNEALMFYATMKIGGYSINHKEINNSIVFRNTLYYNYSQADIFVEFFKQERGSQATESANLTGGRYVELSKNLKESYLNKLHCDFTITVKEKSFRVHKMVLATRSTVFAAMMKSEMKEKKTNSLNITDCDPGAFHVFLLYLYSGGIEELSNENVTDVYVIADKYGVGNLKKDCVEYMKKNLSVDRFCDVIQLATKYNELELLKASKEFFVKNSRKIVSSVDLSTSNFQLLMKKNTALASELILLLTPGN